MFYLELRTRSASVHVNSKLDIPAPPSYISSSTSMAQASDNIIPILGDFMVMDIVSKNFLNEAPFHLQSAEQLICMSADLSSISVELSKQMLDLHMRVSARSRSSNTLCRRVDDNLNSKEDEERMINNCIATAEKVIHWKECIFIANGGQICMNQQMLLLDLVIVSSNF